MPDGLGLAGEGLIMVQHTLGDWAVAPDIVGDNALDITCAGREGMIEIAQVKIGFNGPIEEEQRANAHLIATAPHLLEMLKSFLSDTDGFSRDELFRRVKIGILDETQMYRILAARNAVAAATGDRT
jgi:hypothetical protein